MSEAKYSIGIDPGWKNLGFALVKEEDKKLSLITSQTFTPAEMGSAVCTSIFNEVTKRGHFPQDTRLTMERYVSYQNINTAEAENILMLIGSLREHFNLFWSGDILLVRAIEWKTELVKLLAKNKGFDNPSTSLDKKFSIAAAHACLDTPGEFKTDHEADAICLAALPLLRERYAKPSTKQK